jgi:catalase
MLYTKVMNDKDRQHLIQNVAGNLRNAKSAEIKARQRKFFSLLV